LRSKCNITGILRANPFGYETDDELTASGTKDIRIHFMYFFFYRDWDVGHGDSSIYSYYQTDGFKHDFFFQSGQRTFQGCTHILLLKELGNPTESWSGLWHITPTGFDKFLLVKIIF